MRRLTALLLTLALATTQAYAGTDAVGEVVELKGSAELHRSSDGSMQTPKVGDSIFLNDRIVTQADGYARLLLRDKSILKVSPSSELAVTSQVLGPENGNTTINLLKGRLRTLVVEKLGANSKYEVHTSVAVAGVRGTVFDVLAGELAEVHCLEGLVDVHNADLAVQGSVLLQPGQYTQVGLGLPPVQPMAIPDFPPEPAAEPLAGPTPPVEPAPAVPDLSAPLAPVAGLVGGVAGLAATAAALAPDQAEPEPVVATSPDIDIYALLLGLYTSIQHEVLTGSRLSPTAADPLGRLVNNPLLNDPAAPAIDHHNGITVPIPYRVLPPAL